MHDKVIQHLPSPAVGLCNFVHYYPRVLYWWVTGNYWDNLKKPVQRMLYTLYYILFFVTLYGSVRTLVNDLLSIW